MTKLINLFMWEYQPHFQYAVESLMNKVMETLAVPGSEIECFLVGARIPDHENPNDVCLEPEDGKWPVSLFNGLFEIIEAEVANHPMQSMYYSDEPSMKDKPENIQRDSVRRVVQRMLCTYDLEHSVSSFAGRPAPVGDYYVVPVLQLPNKLFERFRPLREPISDDYVTGHPSLIHATVYEVLAEAHDELLRPDPGRHIDGRLRSSEEIARRAATSFMRTLGIAIKDRNFGYPNIFEQFNSISSLMYEGMEGTGRLLLADPDSESVSMRLKFAKPVPFHEFRWSRKVLQMASPKIALIADCKNIYGLGNTVTNSDLWTEQKVFEIEFLDHYHWRLLCGEEVMLVSRYGTPSLPQEKFPRERLLDTYKRLFPKSREEDIAHFAELFETAVNQRLGSMLIVAEDAKSEADRLQGQGTKIEPTKLTPDLYRQSSGIDGSILIDPHGICYAIGVILDGSARPECAPSRGARYNSGIRYVSATNIPRLAVVVSDDHTVDVIPVLPLRIKRSDIDSAIEKLESATRHTCHPAINWLNHHRFYLNQEQCDQVNTTLKRIKSELLEAGEITMDWKLFSPHPDLDDSYFENEDIELVES